MSNSDLSARVRALIEEAGGRAAFVERVWPGSRARISLSNKAKLSKWAAGKTGMSLGEIEQVADAFDRRRAWLLWGELPERVSVSRGDVLLEADVAERVTAGLRQSAQDQPWAEQLGSVRVDGQAALDSIIQREVSELSRAWAVAETYATSAKEASALTLDAAAQIGVDPNALQQVQAILSVLHRVAFTREAFWQELRSAVLQRSRATQVTRGSVKLPRRQSVEPHKPQGRRPKRVRRARR